MSSLSHTHIHAHTLKLPAYKSRLRRLKKDEEFLRGICLPLYVCVFTKLSSIFLFFYLKNKKRTKNLSAICTPVLTATYLDLRRGAGGIGALVRAVAVAVGVIPLQLAFAWATFQVWRCKTRQVSEQQYWKQNQASIRATIQEAKLGKYYRKKYRKQNQASIRATIQEAKPGKY